MKRGLRLALVILTGLAVAEPLSAQQPRKVVPLQGTQAFRQILDHEQLEPLESIADWSKADPKQTILVVLGATQPLERIQQAKGLRQFLDEGGAILIASDVDDEERLLEFDVQITGEPAWGVDRFYRDNPNCPVVIAGAAGRSLFAEVTKEVATNGPSSVVSSRHPAAAQFMSWRFRGGWERLTFGVVVPGKARAGRLLVLGDPDMFTNSMMIRLDNDNFTFAWNCVRWLQETENGGRRKQVLFIENGTIIKSFKGPLAISVPRLSLATVVNHMLHRMQEDNLFNKLLHNLVPPHWIWRGVLIVTTALLLFFGRRWLVRSRERAPVGLPLVDQSLAAMLDELPLLSRRHRAMIRSGNYYETARALARHAFDLHRGPVAAGMPLPGGPSRQVRWLWDLAYGTTPTPISRRRLGEVIAACQTLEFSRP